MKGTDLSCWISKRRDLERESTQTTAKVSTYGGMLLLLSVTQPGRDFGPPSALRPSFTRGVPLSFQVLLQKTHMRGSTRCNWQLNNLDQRCQALLISGLSIWQVSAITTSSKIETYCQPNGQRPPLSRFCNNFIMLRVVLDEFLNMPFLNNERQN